MSINKPKGTEDLIASDALLWRHMCNVAECTFSLFGYAPVEIPTFEQENVFIHGLGSATDVVRKEMFSVLSPDAYAKCSQGHPDTLKPDQRLALRPEGTAGCVRALIEHGLVAQGAAPQKWWYAGSMFRAERPQKGRLREFHQIGAEDIGDTNPAADAEMIVMFVRFIEALGISRNNVRILLNSMGDEACRVPYRASVAAFIRDHAAQLCPECVRRADSNPLRAFDCKNPQCREIMSAAPKITDALCSDCRAHYEQVKALLDTQNICYEEDPTLVRGLDYYTRTVFEVQVDDGLGAQNAIGGGGRYDKLVEVMGGKPTAALGFAAGFERIALAMRALGCTCPEPAAPDVFVARASGDVEPTAFMLVQSLREAGFAVEADRQGRSLKSQFKLADKYGVRAVVVVGPDELARGAVRVRDMHSRTETEVKLADSAVFLTQLFASEYERVQCSREVT